MSDLRYKNILKKFFLLSIFLWIALSFISVPKPKAIRHIENKSKIRLPRGTKVLHSEFRGLSFLGDGNDIILLEIPKEKGEEFALDLQSKGWGEIEEEAYGTLLNAKDVTNKYNFSIFRTNERNKDQDKHHSDSLGWISFDREIEHTEVPGRYADVMVALYNIKERKLLFVHHNS